MILYIADNAIEYMVEVTNYEPRTNEPHGETTEESIDYKIIEIYAVKHSEGFDAEDLIAGRPEMDALVLKKYLN